MKAFSCICCRYCFGIRVFAVLTFRVFWLGEKGFVELDLDCEGFRDFWVQVSSVIRIAASRDILEAWGLGGRFAFRVFPEWL